MTVTLRLSGQDLQCLQRAICLVHNRAEVICTTLRVNRLDIIGSEDRAPLSALPSFQAGAQFTGSFNGAPLNLRLGGAGSVLRLRAARPVTVL